MKVFSMRLFGVIISIIICFSAVVPSFSAGDPLSVSAKGAILVEGDSGTVIWSKNSDVRLPLASTTKIMTALAALENYSDIGKVVTVDKRACGVEGSSVYLKPGEKLTMEQLLEALLLESANDAAAAIAIEVAGSVEKFAEIMNGTAKKLGMKDSHFMNPHGLDHEDHYTTASDMAKLAVAALKNDDLARIVSTYKTTIPLNGDEGTRLLLNHNKLLKYYDGAVGMKTGFTKRSGRCLVSAAKRDGVTMIAVTLNAPDDWNDHRAMLDYGFSRYKRIEVAVPGCVRHSVAVTGGDSSSVTVSNADRYAITVPTNSPEPKCVIEAPRFVYAPVSEGDVLGYARYFIGENEVAKLPLYAESGCERLPDPTLWERILDFFK